MRSSLERLLSRLVRLYRTAIGDVQVMQEYTGRDLEYVAYFGYTESKDEIRVMYTVRQIRYLRVYSRWWMMESAVYQYDLRYIKFIGVNAVDKGQTFYPQLCSKWLYRTYRPHVQAIDCDIKHMRYISRP